MFLGCRGVNSLVKINSGRIIKLGGFQKYIFLTLFSILVLNSSNISYANNIHIGFEQGLSTASFSTGDIATSHIRWLGLFQAGLESQKFDLSLRFGYSPALNTSLNAVGGNAHDLPILLSADRLFRKKADWTYGIGLTGGAVYSLSSGENFSKNRWLPEYGMGARGEYQISDRMRGGIKVDVLLHRGLNVNLTNYWRF